MKLSVNFTDLSSLPLITKLVKWLLRYVYFSFRQSLVAFTVILGCSVTKGVLLKPACTLRLHP